MRMSPMAIIRARLVPDGECMVYTGADDGQGYRRFGGKDQRVHRTWWLGHGREIPA